MHRDTDADWAHIADHEPFFGVLANPEFLRENLDAAALNKFFQSGRTDIDHVIATIRRHLVSDFRPELAVDFGCGVGRLTIAMSHHSSKVVGVDVAPGMRKLAGENAAEQSIENVEFSGDAPSKDVDWVNSLIVFQHIPPDQGFRLLTRLADSVKAGGVISLQITTHRDSRHLHEVFRDVAFARYDGQAMRVFSTREVSAVGHMSMYDYDLGQVCAILSERQFSKLWLEATDHAGMHGYWIFARRDS